MIGRDYPDAYVPPPDEAWTPDPLDGMVSADWLLAQDFPPLRYVVDGMIPEGLTVLAASPKAGKSWMVLGLAIAAATGGNAFDSIPVEPRPVLYLALEDGHRRLSDRLQSLGVAAAPPALYFKTSTHPHPAVDVIAAFVERHKSAAPLVIVDTLGKTMGSKTSNETAYAHDYRKTAELQAIVKAAPGAALILVHHVRKADGTDFVAAVSGTHGIAGAADTIAVLRRDRQAADATLEVTSRDAREGRYALHIDTRGTWTLVGHDLAAAANAAEHDDTTRGLGDPMSRLITYVNQHPEGVRPADVAAELGWSSNKASTYLARARNAERITSPSRGLYIPVCCVVNPPLETTHTTQHTPHIGDCHLHPDTPQPEACWTCQQNTPAPAVAGAAPTGPHGALDPKVANL